MAVPKFQSLMMPMRTGTKRRVRFFLGVLCFGSVGGAVLGSVIGSVYGDMPLFWVLVGGIHSMMLVSVIVGTEIFLPQTRLGHALERAPFLVTVAAKWLVYGTVILLVTRGRLAQRLIAVVLGGDLGSALVQAKTIPPALSIALAFIFMHVYIFLIQMGRLIGERTLRDIVLGRYHRPRTEERFFLFVDIAGSTPLAERLGPTAVHRFLGRVFQLAAAPIDDHGGDIYQYVGDEMVITWTVSEGRARARPLACFFAIEQAFERAAPAFEHDFGAVPRLRAALHAGPVIAGEVGESRRAIVFHGDVMNTASRLEGAARDLERSFLVSGDALERLEGVEAYAVEDLGQQQLRGRAAAVCVYAVTAKP